MVAGPVKIFLTRAIEDRTSEGPGPRRIPAPKSSTGPRYARGGLRTVRRSVLPSSFTTSSVVSRVHRRLRRLERLTFTSVLDAVFRLRS